jgi:hypothetical protein
VLEENRNNVNKIQKLIKNIRDYCGKCLNEMMGFVKIWTSLLALSAAQSTLSAAQSALSAAQAHPPHPEFLQVRGKTF